MMRVKANRITPENFAKFGRVVKTPSGEPTSQASDYKFWSDIAHYLIEGETEIGICTVYRQRTSQISGVERHLKTPEILIPVDGPFILPVLLEGEPNAGIEAFRVNLGEAAVTNKGVWHGACLPVGKKKISYFVIFRRNTPFEDVEKKTIQSTAIRA